MAGYAPIEVKLSVRQREPGEPRVSRQLAFYARLLDPMRPPTREEVTAAEIHRALYRLGQKTPYGREPGDWIGEDPPTWAWPRRPGDTVVYFSGSGTHVEVTG